MTHDIIYLSIITSLLKGKHIKSEIKWVLNRVYFEENKAPNVASAQPALRLIAGMSSDIKLRNSHLSTSGATGERGNSNFSCVS